MKKIIIVLVTFSIIALFGCSDSKGKVNETRNEKEVVTNQEDNEVALEKSKIALADMKEFIIGKDGFVSYVYGTIESDKKTITVKIKDENGSVKDTIIDVYEFEFATKNNGSYRILLDVDGLSAPDFKKGDSIKYELDPVYNSAWYIGENREVLYLYIGDLSMIDKGSNVKSKETLEKELKNILVGNEIYSLDILTLNSGGYSASVQIKSDENNPIELAMKIENKIKEVIQVYDIKIINSKYQIAGWVDDKGVINVDDEGIRKID